MAVSRSDCPIHLMLSAKLEASISSIPAERNLLGFDLPMASDCCWLMVERAVISLGSKVNFLGVVAIWIVFSSSSSVILIDFCCGDELLVDDVCIVELAPVLVPG